MMKCTVLQPTYLPWIGYFEMIATADIFIVYDDVQFVKQSWQQRNRIKSQTGITMLSVPVKHDKYNTKIFNKKISYDNGNPLEKHWRVIEQSYRKSKYFNDYADRFVDVYTQEYTFLEELNIKIIAVACDILKIKTRFVFSKEIDIATNGIDKNEDLIILCRAVGADHLYDAKGAESFLDKNVFRAKGIDIQFQEYKHPVYTQLWGEFQPYMSVIDLIFNEGPASMEIIQSGRKE